MADRMKHLTGLLGNPDAKVRLYALDEVIHSAHRMTESELATILESASVDEDRTVAMRAAEGLAILEQRGFKQLRRARDRRTGLLELSEGLESDVEAREASFKILDDVLIALGDMVGDMAVSRSNAALDALAVFRYPPSLGPMLKALSRRDTGAAAARAVSRYPEDAALPVFRKVLERPTYPEAVPVIMGALGDLMGEDSFHLLRTHLVHDEDRVREAVALALGGRAEKEAEELLIKLCRDESPVVVQAAVTSLGLVGEGKGAEELHSVFVNAGDERIQAAVLTALGLIHRSESVEVIAKGLRSTDGRVRANAIEALAGFNLRAPEAVRYFEPALKDDNNRAVGNAILALYPYDRDRATAALHRLLKAKEPLKRSTAAFIIGEIQDPVLMQGLIIMINTEQDRNVLSSALTSIERIRNPEMKIGISKLCQHPNDLIRGRAIQIFAGMSGLSELKVLESYFQKETSPAVKATIVAAFGHVCDMNHLAFLKEKLHNPDDRIVANAVEALDRIGGLENVELIEPLVGHRSPRVRANALIALWHQGSLRAADKLGQILDSTDDDQISSGLHAARSFANAVTSLGLKRHPLLRSALRSAFERMSSMGMTAWDIFKSTSFYQDVIQASQIPEEVPTEEELEQVPTISLDMPPPDEAPAGPGAAESAGVAPAPPPGDGVGPGEAPLVAGLGALVSGQPGKAREIFGKALDTASPAVRGMLLHLARRAARESGELPPDAPLAEPEGALPFLPLHTARIEKARQSHDLEDSLTGYFSLYRAQIELLQKLIDVGEQTLEDGNEAGAARIAKDLAQSLKGDASLHRKLGNLHFGMRDYPAAFQHMLRAWAHTPDEPELVLRLASVAARIGKQKLARGMLKVLLERMESSADVQAKAAGLERILEKKTSN